MKLSIHQAGERPWHLLHLLAALFIPLIVIFLAGCIRAKEEKADLGSEVSPDQIDQALSKAVEGADLSGTAVGQYTNYSVIRRLENEESTVNLGYTKVKVIEKSETSSDVIFTLNVEKASRQSDNSFEIRQLEESLTLHKAPLVPQSASPGEFTTAGISARAAANGKQPTKVTYHRLRESSGNMDVPAPVKNRADCGGLAGCTLPVRYIQFDLVQWYSDDTYQKISLDFAFSAKTPYLPYGQGFDQLNGLLVADCRATVVPVEGRTVYVRDCLNLEDFQK